MKIGMVTDSLAHLSFDEMLIQKMAVRTLRHIYLFMKTRCMREERLEMA